jgi:hypothetical protein
MKWLMIQLVLLYRVTLGRLLGGQCRITRRAASTRSTR